MFWNKTCFLDVIRRYISVDTSVKDVVLLLSYCLKFGNADLFGAGEDVFDSRWWYVDNIERNIAF